LGEIFGKLKVIEFSKLDYKQQAWWICQCECGNKKSIRSWQLKSGDIKSCGCLYRKRYGDITGRHFSNIKAHARWKKMEFELNIKDMWNLFLKQQKKCKLSGVDIVFDVICEKNTTASLDRIDSSKGYVNGNVQWVHKDVNQMKSNRTESVFLDWIKKLYEYNLMS
jgi:hypothetical protein